MSLRKNSEPSVIIEAGKLAFFPDWRELWKYRDLFRMFVYRDFVLYYKQTFVGPLWWMIQPILLAGTFSLVFGKIAKFQTLDVPVFLFYFSGILFWSFFSETISGISNCFFQHASLYGKVYFPRLIVPLAFVANLFLRLSFQLLVFVIIYVVYCMSGSYSNHLSDNFWMMFFCVFFAALFGFSLGLVIASSSVRFRDLSLLTSFLLQLWMFLSPVLYPVEMLPKEFRWIHSMNPMAFLLENFRAVFFNSGMVVDGLGWFLVMVTSVFILSQILFARAEKTFVDNL